MLELEEIYKRGKRTFVFLMFKYGWWIFALAIGLGYLAFSVYFGKLHDPVGDFLNKHSDWYVDSSMLSLWIFLIAVSLLLFGYLKVNVHYRQYKFMLDEHAFHLRKGLFFVKEITIPYGQISNVHIGRPYHYRIFGIAELDILSTSGGIVKRKEKNYLIPVLDLSLARELSKHLVRMSSSRMSNEEEDFSKDDLDDLDDLDE